MERCLGAAIIHDTPLFLLPSSLATFPVSSSRLILSRASFEPFFLLYIETAPLPWTHSATDLQPPWIRASRPSSAERRGTERRPRVKSWKEQRVTGGGGKRKRGGGGGAGDYKRRKIYNPRMKFIRTSHLPLSTLRRLQRASSYSFLSLSLFLFYLRVSRSSSYRHNPSSLSLSAQSAALWQPERTRGR